MNAYLKNIVYFWLSVLLVVPSCITMIVVGCQQYREWKSDQHVFTIIEYLGVVHSPSSGGAQYTYQWNNGCICQSDWPLEIGSIFRMCVESSSCPIDCDTDRVAPGQIVLLFGVAILVSYVAVLVLAVVVSYKNTGYHPCSCFVTPTDRSPLPLTHL